jgi:hypothetical protein
MELELDRNCGNSFVFLIIAEPNNTDNTPLSAASRTIVLQNNKAIYSFHDEQIRQ